MVYFRILRENVSRIVFNECYKLMCTNQCIALSVNVRSIPSSISKLI